MALKDKLICKACEAKGSLRVFEVKEMMLGLRQIFDYGECHQCNSIQIITVPDDLSRFYPENYYPYQPSKTAKKTLFQWLAEQRQEYMQGRKNIVGRFLKNIFGIPLVTPVDWIRLAEIRADHRVLDIGCGSGGLLTKMQKQGFKKLTGVDPFMSTPIKSDGFELLKTDIKNLDGEFDFIMLSHSFEHMVSPLEALNEIYRLCAPAGTVLMRIPIAGNFAWRKYGASWFQLDAPRHLFIPSVKGFEALVKRSGFEIFKMVFDSTHLQFTLSEKYIRNIPLGLPDNKKYSKQELQFFAKKSGELNELMDGDQAGFFLRKRMCLT